MGLPRKLICSDSVFECEVDFVIIEGEALVLADQEVQADTRHGLVLLEIEVVLEVHVAAGVEDARVRTDRRVVVGVVAAHPHTDVVQRRRLRLLVAVLRMRGGTQDG
jgi:hypothetical protein